MNVLNLFRYSLISLSGLLGTLLGVGRQYAYFLVRNRKFALSTFAQTISDACLPWRLLFHFRDLWKTASCWIRWMAHFRKSRWCILLILIGFVVLVVILRLGQLRRLTLSAPARHSRPSSVMFDSFGKRVVVVLIVSNLYVARRLFAAIRVAAALLRVH